MAERSLAYQLASYWVKTDEDRRRLEAGEILTEETCLWMRNAFEAVNKIYEQGVELSDITADGFKIVVHVKRDPLRERVFSLEVFFDSNQTGGRYSKTMLWENDRRYNQYTKYQDDIVGVFMEISAKRKFVIERVDPEFAERQRNWADMVEERPRRRRGPAFAEEDEDEEDSDEDIDMDGEDEIPPLNDEPGPPPVPPPPPAPQAPREDPGPPPPVPPPPHIPPIQIPPLYDEESDDEEDI